MLTEYAIKMGGNAKTTTYLPSGSDLDLFYPEAKDEELLKKYNIKKNDQVILFAGTLYDFSGLDVLIKYLAENKSIATNMKFLIVGHGQQSAFLEKLIKESNLGEKIILTGFIDYAKLAKYINLADICINPFRINKVTNIIFPGKIYQYMACEKPVIATRLEGVMGIFPDDGGKNNIFYFDLNNPKEFFDLAKNIGKTKVKDVNPSLQEISDILYKKIEKLK